MKASSDASSIPWFARTARAKSPQHEEPRYRRRTVRESPGCRGSRNLMMSGDAASHARQSLILVDESVEGDRRVALSIDCLQGAEIVDIRLLPPASIWLRVASALAATWSMWLHSAHHPWHAGGASNLFCGEWSDIHTARPSLRLGLDISSDTSSSRVEVGRRPILDRARSRSLLRALRNFRSSGSGRPVHIQCA